MEESSYHSNEQKIDRLVNYLNKEISEIESIRKKPGWTTWAIAGTIAYLFWSLFSIVEVNQINWTLVPALFLAISITFETIILFYRFIEKTETEIVEGKRFEKSDISLLETRGFVFSILIRAVIFILIVVNLPLVIPKVVSIAVYIYLGIIIFISLSAFLISFLHYPIPRSGKTKQQKYAFFDGICITYQWCYSGIRAFLLYSISRPCAIACGLAYFFHSLWTFNSTSTAY